MGISVCQGPVCQRKFDRNCHAHRTHAPADFIGKCEGPWRKHYGTCCSSDEVHPARCDLNVLSMCLIFPVLFSLLSHILCCMSQIHNKHFLGSLTISNEPGNCSNRWDCTMNPVPVFLVLFICVLIGVFPFGGVELYHVHNMCKLGQVEITQLNVMSIG